MAATAERTDPHLWEQVKAKVKRGGKGGAPGQWSARKAQLAVADYKRQGGGYRGRKSADNHLAQWTREEWGTRSGKPSGETHERYLPKAARKKLTRAEYDRTTARKRADTAKGKQFSRQPKDVAQKVASTRAPYRRPRDSGEPTKAALMAEARRRDIPGRSRMDKAALLRALRRTG
ncbi:MAG: hypothetical protein BGO51_12715 [Rhodospirillales bacterium 69-11]|nr:hypothetical protein [Rhodospirillales bacterium]OJW24932.1 MAG: hypothetical protein BGO51_12715 [Rhodospirillales bacterium 69-11]